ncbi:50S ribosomal protein L5 [Candidatus Shapirobacteria bacterium]|nr:50S ribosomal protein L5 [Candidatus Shapirobacteria bacterium]
MTTSTSSLTSTLLDSLHEQFPKRNLHSFPSLKKVVLNYRVSEGRDSQETLAVAESELVSIAGQKPRLCKSKKSISTFKLREGEPLAYKVTLRGLRMHQFIEKLFNIVLPRLRDFKGMPLKAFDESGNYNLTIKDQTYFPEINLDKVNKIRPIQITLCISSSSKEDSKMLLSALGFPFEKQ